jgi:3',5'-cyclic-AMP phosphodiesterase
MAQDDKDGLDRRGALECMIWAGTGVLWTMAGGVPRSSSLLGISAANAQAAKGFNFLQISDSHIGFKQPVNPNPLATLDEAIAKVGALASKPAFMIHTGDITHLSKPEEFDNADQAIGKARLDTHYVPGEHDIVDEDRGRAYLERYGKQGHRLVFIRPRRRTLRRPRQCGRPQVGRHGRGRRSAARLARRRP